MNHDKDHVNMFIYTLTKRDCGANFFSHHKIRKTINYMTSFQAAAHPTAPSTSKHQSKRVAHIYLPYYPATTTGFFLRMPMVMYQTNRLPQSICLGNNFCAKDTSKITGQNKGTVCCGPTFSAQSNCALIKKNNKEEKQNLADNHGTCGSGKAIQSSHSLSQLKTIDLQTYVPRDFSIIHRGSFPSISCLNGEVFIGK